MAKTKNSSEETSRRRAFWQGEIDKAKKRYRNFWSSGDTVVDTYRMQKADEVEVASKDKYNILFSSTETIRPNLYAQTPVVRVKLRNRDTENPTVRIGARMLEGCLAYVLDEEDFDEVMENVVEDLLLPGLGTAWVRYEPQFGKSEGQEVLLDEHVRIDYVYWQDFLTGLSRGWKPVPWVAKRVWKDKRECVALFGAEKANKLEYCARENTGRDGDNNGETAEIWEIWDKRDRMVHWYCESYPGDLLDSKPDPLKLKNFFPCPRPLRAISNTRTLVPRAYYSQYKSQAETLNTMTRRIRLLGEALKVVGLYNAAEAKLANALNPGTGNTMIAVDQWAMFAQAGGIKGNVEWLPIEQIAQTLIQLQQAREVAKNEIYEITGFSDIIRGVSKASETLGAQNIKQNWAGARVKKAQKEVQRFARDIIAIAGEIIAEHCDPATIAKFSAVDIPDPESILPGSPAEEQMLAFEQAVDFIRNESRRVSTINIETDSTILADEEAERKDRMDFLGAAGAFLQQAVPAMQSTPELGPLLGAMLMFTIRTFPSSRSIEEEFEKVQKVLANKPAPPQESDPNGHAAKAQAAQAVAGIKAQADQQRAQTDQQTRQSELQAEGAIEQAKLAQAAREADMRHAEAMAKIELEVRFKAQEFALREREVAVKEAELGIKRQQADTQEFAAQANAENAERAQDTATEVAGHDAALKDRAQDTSEATAAHGASMAEAEHEQRETQMEQDATKGLTEEKD